MPEIDSFRDLVVWQRSMDLAVRCHQIVRTFPKAEEFALGHQVRKSSISMPSNIAEGFSRHSTPYYVQHLRTAYASGAELETQIELGRRMALVEELEANALINDAQEIAKMINGLIRSLDRPKLEKV